MLSASNFKSIVNARNTYKLNYLLIAIEFFLEDREDKQRVEVLFTTDVPVVSA